MSETNLPGTRSARLRAIQTIITETKIRSQRELAEKLYSLGIDVTQPTLSRDLDDLSVGKDRAGYYILSENDNSPYQRLQRTLRELLVQIEVTQQLCVLRTPPGGAHLVAGSIDQARIPGVLGTIAGDDTILMITDNSNSAAKIRDEFLKLVEPMTKDKEKQWQRTE